MAIPFPPTSCPVSGRERFRLGATSLPVSRESSASPPCWQAEAMKRSLFSYPTDLEGHAPTNSKRVTDAQGSAHLGPKMPGSVTSAAGKAYEHLQTPTILERHLQSREDPPCHPGPLETALETSEEGTSANPPSRSGQTAVSGNSSKPVWGVCPATR